ncbi:CRE-BET-2 protein [Caenorhabditis remanei]|uniref:CRE-BET-2 protein n=1 Tax=Caenorhabditis remanei TaxID=31234 RepID=E3M206_CAERE|nr:CRE-BET-2 protein [Caenorhabditis remanei]
MDDFSSKASGSLARIGGDYALSSEDSDQDDEESPVAPEPKLTENVESSDVAVPEGFPAEGNVQTSPILCPESLSAAVGEMKEPDEQEVKPVKSAIESEEATNDSDELKTESEELKSDNNVAEEIEKVDDEAMETEDEPGAVTAKSSDAESNSDDGYGKKTSSNSSSSSKSSKSNTPSPEPSFDVSVMNSSIPNLGNISPEPNTSTTPIEVESQMTINRSNSASPKARSESPEQPRTPGGRDFSPTLDIPMTPENMDSPIPSTSEDQNPKTPESYHSMEAEEPKTPAPQSSKESSEVPDIVKDEPEEMDTTEQDKAESEEPRVEDADDENVKKKEDSSDSDSDDSDEDPVEKPHPAKRPLPTENPWESPRQAPINGIVQPRTEPPPGKPTRHTNRLDYILFTVVKDALKHKHSWPFQAPVDAKSLQIPEYHNTIARPMDLRTIEKRLRNTYYYCADDAIRDIKQMFSNCYMFNPPEYDVYKMAKTLDAQMTGQLANLTFLDLKTLFENCKQFNDRNDDIYIMCENVEGVVQRGLEWLPQEEKPQELPEHQRHAIFSAPDATGKTPKAAKTRGRKSLRGRRKVGVPRASTASFKEESMDEQDEAEVKEEAVPVEEEVEEAAPEKTPKSRSVSLQPEIEEVKPSSSQPPAKKRKVENGTVPVEDATPAPPPAVPEVEAPPKVPRLKNPNSMIDWKHLPPRWIGKQSEWQKFCVKLLNEMHSVKNKSFAQVFYVPVDPVKLKIVDYLEVIKEPMDLQTIKKKLDYKQYTSGEEFERDMNLMIDNCCTYNPAGSAVHQNALDLKALFESRWKLFPRPGVDPIVSDSYIRQNLVVNTDLIEDERINSYINAVKIEEKKCAEKLEQLRTMGEGLYSIALKRREAKLAGQIAPALETTQISELEKLGVSIKNAPISIPELISPALSVRSSSRAPVPKIIDDIGPSPIKARKISKPRASIASNASAVGYTAPAPASSRGRKPKKSGRSVKKEYSPEYRGELNPQAPGGPYNGPYKSVFGTKSIDDKSAFSEKLSVCPGTYVRGVIRLIQISNYHSNKEVKPFNAMCSTEIDATEFSPDLILELLDYLTLIEAEPSVAKLWRETLDRKARILGIHTEGEKPSHHCKHHFIFSDDQDQFPNEGGKRAGSDSPSPSASRCGVPSSGSDTSDDSSDSDDEPEKPRSSVPRQLAVEINRSGSSSRASTPAGPSKVAAPPVNRKGGPSSSSSKPPYVTRTLSESSSSSDSGGSSSDSSDSDSETKPTVKKPVPQLKKQESVTKKPATIAKKPESLKKPLPPKKKVHHTILDDLLPETPAKKPVAPSVPTTSKVVRQATKDLTPQPYMSPEQYRLLEEERHKEALRRQAEARLKRKAEETAYNHQMDVMTEFEFNNCTY